MDSDGTGAGPGTRVEVDIQPGQAAGTWSVTFRSEAVPGTLAAFTGTLSALRLDIMTALVREHDGTVEDTFEVAPLDGASFSTSAASRLAHLAADVVNERHDLTAELLELRRKHAPLADVAPRVESSATSTLTTGLNIVCGDRPGLLHDLTRTLAKHELLTRALSVLAFQDKAHVTFRVVDSEGHPPVDEAFLEVLRADLAAACG
jgi:[protein-PII] uridylyltransferase